MDTEALADVVQRLERIESFLELLAKKRNPQEWYSTADLAAILGKAQYTVREWARGGRIRSERRPCGRGKTQEYMISHEELTRIQSEGLLPIPTYRHVR